MPTLHELYGLDTPVAAPPADDSGQFTRGFKRSFSELPGLAAGVGAFAADAVGADGARDKMLAYAKQRADEEQQTHGADAASLTDAWDGKTSWGDFLANAAGYTTGQALQALLTGGVGSLGARMVAKAGAREAGAIAAARAIASGASEQAARGAAEEAVLSRAKNVGAAAGAGAHNLGMELGSIYPDAVDQAKKEGRELDGGDLARVGLSALGAAGVDTAAEGVMAGRILKGSGAAGGIVRRAAAEIPAGAAREAGTEAVQTAIEHYGAGQPIADEAGIRDIVDSAGVGAVGGGLGGGLASSHAHQQPAAAEDASAAPVAAAPVAASTTPAPLEVGDFQWTPPAAPEPTVGGSTSAPGALDFEADQRFENAPVVRSGEQAPPQAVFGTQQAANIAIGEQGLLGSHIAVQAGPNAWEIRPAAAPGMTMIRPGVYDTGEPPAATPSLGDAVRSQMLPSTGTISNAINAGIAAAADRFDSTPLPQTPVPVDPQHASALLDFANRRASELETKSTGVPEKKVPGPDGKPTVVPAVPKQFLTPTEQAEQQFLAENGGDAQALAAHYSPTPPAGPVAAPAPVAGMDRSTPVSAPPAVPVPGVSVPPAQDHIAAPAAAAATAAPVRPTVTGPDGSQRAVFDTEDDARGYMTAARRRGASVKALPLQMDDGRWMLATPAEVEASKTYETHVNKSGAPFKHRGQAMAVAKKLGGGEPVEVPGGWGVRKEVPRVIKPAPAPEAEPAGMPEWAAFPAESGTLGVPRAEMPQVKAEHRGAMVNFLEARGIAHQTVEVDPTTLKPTQAEFSPARVLSASENTDGDRSILVSSDGHVLDGHHQWMAAALAHEPVKAIVLDAPIAKLVDEVKQFPSAELHDGATSAETDRPIPSDTAQISAEIDAIGRVADERIAQAAKDSPNAISGAGIDYLNEAERARLHALQMAMPRADNGKDAARARLAAKVAARKTEAAATPAPKAKRAPAAAKAAKARMDKLAQYFAPGNIVSNWAGHDRVVSFEPRDDGSFSVKVQSVVKQGGAWVQDPNDRRTRTHETPPSAKELAAGPIERAAVMNAAPASSASEEEGADAVPFSRRAAGAVDLPKVEIGTALAQMNRHPDYAAAKAGDPAAALRLARDLVSPAFIERVRALVGNRKAIIQPIVSVEQAGKNKIPAAVAEVLAHELGLTAGEGIVQSNSPKRTAMQGMDRLFGMPEFDGPVRAGVDYVIVDDALTQGGTFAALASHIRAGGGNVLGAASLTGKQYSATLALTPDTLKQLREKYSDVEPAFRAANGYGFDSLTESEARYLLKHDSPAEVRARIAAEGRLGGSARDAQDAEGQPPVAFGRGAPSAAPDRAASVRALATRIASRWSDAPKVVVVNGMDDPAIPAAARAEDAKQRSQGASGAPEGLFHDGTVYLLANQLPGDADVVRVLMHEVLGHYGLRSVYGSALGPILDRLATLNAGKVRAKAQQYGLDFNKQSDRRAAAEEVLAEMAQTNPQIGWVKRAVAAVRSWLREHIPGFPKMAFSDDEIVSNFLAPARDRVQRGATATSSASAQPAPAFSRSLGAALSQSLNNAREVALPAGYKVANLMDSISPVGTISWWHKTVGTQYNLAQRYPTFRRVFDTAQQFINDVSHYANDAADQAPTILPKLQAWKDIWKSPLSARDTKALAAPVFEGTLLWTRDANGTPQRVTRAGDERAGIVWTDDELRTKFGLDAGQIGIYREFRRSVDRSLTSLAISDMVRYAGKDAADVREQALEAGDVDAAARILAEHLRDEAANDADRAEVLRNTAENVEAKAERAAQLMRDGYAPLSRFGQYTLDVVDKDGNRAYFGLFESAAERAKMADRMAAAYPGATISQGTTSQEEFKLFAGVSPETLALFGDMIGLEEQGDDAASQAFQQYLKLAKSNRSAMKRLIERKGIAGFSEDVGRVLAGFIYSNARQTSSNLHLGELTDATAAIPQGNGQLKDAAVRLGDYVKNPVEEAQGIRGLLFAQYLGGSVASAMVNALQPIGVTFPYLSQFGGMAAAGAQMARAVADAAKPSTGDAALDAALKRAEEDGIVSPQEVHALQAHAAGRAQLRSGDGTPVGDAAAKARNGLSRLALAWGKVFGVAEQWNRRVTFIAAYRTAVAQGIANPAQFAEKAISETQFVYNKGNKPKWARGAIGSTLFTFKQYSISYVELLHRMWTAGPEGKKAALLALAVLFLMSGTDGLPFSDDIGDVIDGALQRMGYNFNTKEARRAFFARVLNDGAAQFLSKGLSGLPGEPIDVSGRIGMGNLIPGTGLLTKKPDHSSDLLEIAGPMGDFGKRIFGAANSLAGGDVGAAVLGVSPTAATNVAKAYDMFTTGAYHDAKGRKVLDVNAFEALAKGAGFQPNTVARTQAAAGEDDRYKALHQQVTGEITAKWAQGLAQNDAAMVQQAKDARDDWNAKNPEAKLKVSMPAVLRQVREMRMTKAQRLEQSSPSGLRAKIKADMAAAAE